MTEKQIAEADTRTLAKIAAAYERTIERFGGLRRVGEREEYEARRRPPVCVESPRTSVLDRARVCVECAAGPRSPGEVDESRYAFEEHRLRFARLIAAALAQRGQPS
jgi:hypothetical protein